MPAGLLEEALGEAHPEKEMPPQVIDESLPQPFKAVRGASQ